MSIGIFIGLVVVTLLGFYAGVAAWVGLYRLICRIGQWGTVGVLIVNIILVSWLTPISIDDGLVGPLVYLWPWALGLLAPPSNEARRS